MRRWSYWRILRMRQPPKFQPEPLALDPLDPPKFHPPEELEPDDPPLKFHPPDDDDALSAA